MAERERVQPQQPESAEVVRDPLLDAFFRLRKPEQVIEFFLHEAHSFMVESDNACTPKQSLENVFNKSLPALCLLVFFYPEKINPWGTALREIDTMLQCSL